MTRSWLPPWPGEAEDGPEWVPALCTHPVYLAAAKEYAQDLRWHGEASFIWRKRELDALRDFVDDGLSASPARLPGDHTGA